MIYTALTIGPIYKTMSQARKSRHLWGASYLFSFIMKKILIHLLKDESLQLNANDILLPHAVLEDIEANNETGTGLYPDRLFIKDNNKVITSRISVYQENIINLLVYYAGNQYKDFFNNYFRIYTVSYELPIALADANNIDDNFNIIWVGNKLLDSLELREKYYSNITTITWNEIIDKLNGKLLYKDAFNNIPNNYQFPSVIEIATDDFRQRNKSRYQELVDEFLRDKEESADNQNNFLEALNNNSHLFKGLTVRPYHKYMAVVQADGDNIGKTIAAIGKNEANINVFSKALFDFAKKAAIAINEYGGKPVYVGGDDLFFFAPVTIREDNSNEEQSIPILRTIFNLIKDLDDIFNEMIIDHDTLSELYKSGITKPSLSYGISIVYSKYPLNEAREIAYNLLQQAKKDVNDKNKICFKVLRHSGQGFGFTVDKKKTNDLSKEPLSYNYFINLCTRIPEDSGLLTSIIFKLAPLHAILNTIGSDKQRMKSFFENMFDEQHHQEPVIKKFINNTSSFIQNVFVDFPEDLEGMPEYESEERSGNLAKIYSTLRFLKMLVDNE